MLNAVSALGMISRHVVPHVDGQLHGRCSLRLRWAVPVLSPATILCATQCYAGCPRTSMSSTGTWSSPASLHQVSQSQPLRLHTRSCLFPMPPSQSCTRRSPGRQRLSRAWCQRARLCRESLVALLPDQAGGHASGTCMCSLPAQLAIRRLLSWLLKRFSSRYMVRFNHTRGHAQRHCPWCPAHATHAAGSPAGATAAGELYQPAWIMPVLPLVCV